MFKLLLTTGILIATLFVIGIFSYQNQSKLEALEKSKDRGKLSWYAEMAKAKGEEEVVLPAPIARYAVAKDLDEAVAHYTFVIAEVVESKSYANNENIRTWYKMRIVEELSAQAVECSSCLKIEDVPSDLLPLQPGQFLVAKSGGNVEVNGIRVISKDFKFPAFEKNKQYLLLLSLDSEKKVGTLRMGPWGAFDFDSNHNINAIDRNLKHPIKEELETRFNSIGKLRVRLASKSKPQR